MGSIQKEENHVKIRKSETEPQKCHQTRNYLVNQNPASGTKFIELILDEVNF